MIELVEPVVRLETSAQGEANWTVPPNQPVADDQAQAGALPMIERLSLRDGSVTYADYASNTSMTVTLAEVQATTTGPEQRLDVEGPVGLLTSRSGLPDTEGRSKTSLAISRILCKCSWSSISGRETSTARWRNPAVAGRGGGGVLSARVPDQPSGNQGQSGQAAPGPGAVSPGGPSDAGGGRLDGARAGRDPGSSDLAGGVSLDVQGKRQCWRRSSSRAPWMSVTWPSPGVPLASRHPLGLQRRKVRTSRQMQSLTWNSPGR